MQCDLERKQNTTPALSISMDLNKQRYHTDISKCSRMICSLRDYTDCTIFIQRLHTHSNFGYTGDNLRDASQQHPCISTCIFQMKCTCLNKDRITSPSWLTHWCRFKMDAISQTTVSNRFSWMKMYEFRLKFHWCFFVRVQLTIFQHWFR